MMFSLYHFWLQHLIQLCSSTLEDIEGQLRMSEF